VQLARVTRKKITNKKTMHIQKIDEYNWPQEPQSFCE